MNRNVLIGLVVVLCACLCLVVAAIGVFALPQTRELFQLYTRGALPTSDATQAALASPTRRAIITPPPIVLGTATPHIFTPLPATPIPSVPRDTLDALQNAKFLPRDLNVIAPRLKKNLLLATPTRLPRARQIGDKESFFVAISTTGGRYRTATATLQVLTPHAYFWVEDGITFNRGELQRAADTFERDIYPTNRRYFGSERIPGPDGDARIHFFNGRLDDSTAGYYSSTDTYPTAIMPYSNQRHVIYMNLPAVSPSRSEYVADLAHEFQHLIHNNQSQQKAGWIDEGMGELAVKLNGFQVHSVSAFAERPDTQLNTWADDAQGTLAHYGAAYFFFNYLVGRFGSDVIRDVILAPCEGICAVQSALNQRAGGLTFDEVFADWAVTNYLNNPSVENGRYAYPSEKEFRVSRETAVSRYPTQLATAIRPYSSNYYALQPDARDVTIYFTGTTTTRLVPTLAHSGQWMWYSNRADLANMNLTREVDLTRTTKATLQFWTWYHIERDFDYAYVEVSTDGGRMWSTLVGKYTTMDDPNGASFGNAYTAKSGAKEEQLPAVWVQEQMDLTLYAGRKILLRFEYITDDVYNTPGFAVDDIAIPEIGFSDDAETSAEGWTVNGFVRVDNVLPQKYIVQVVQIGNGVRISRLPLDAQNRGNLTITGLNSFSRVEVIVTAHAATTTEATEYQFAVVAK